MYCRDVVKGSENRNVRKPTKYGTKVSILPVRVGSTALVQPSIMVQYLYHHTVQVQLPGAREGARQAN